MTPEVAVDLFREALWLIVLIVGLAVVPSLVVGLIVAMFQAATQINEQTLSFLPRLMVMLITLILSLIHIWWWWYPPSISNWTAVAATCTSPCRTR